MKRIPSTCLGTFLILFAFLTTAPAADTYVLSGETLRVGEGEHYERIVVYPHGTLLIDGGSITQAPPITLDSVEVSAGGSCVMTNGVIDYFMNNGRVEMYGGSTGSSSSENHGYMMLAGGDPGGQIVQQGGVLDIFYTATTRTNLEISSPGGNFNATVTHLIPTNWNGTIVSEPMVAPSPTDVVCQIDSAIELTWPSVSNRGYQVQYTTNLLSGDWQDLGSPVYSTTGTNLVFDEADEDIKAYRAKTLH